MQVVPRDGEVAARDGGIVLDEIVSVQAKPTMSVDERSMDVNEEGKELARRGRPSQAS